MSSLTAEDLASDPPPPYEECERPPPPAQPALPRIDPTPSAGSPIAFTVTRDQCIAHLKFLAVLADLRDTVASIPGLFGIADANEKLFQEHTNEAQIRVKEKRWAVYTARAVERYATWWEACIVNCKSPPAADHLYRIWYEDVVRLENPIQWVPEMLPPLDVLMVLHAHMLSPRGFLEDCIRYGKRGLWSSGFPWGAVNECITNDTLEYQVPADARQSFEQKTGLFWDNLHDPETKTLHCPSCRVQIAVPWTYGEISLPMDRAFDEFCGFADHRFSARCPSCRFQIDHERLKVDKFRKDIEALLHRHLPMPGTLYNLRGVPEANVKGERRKSQSTFPNRFIRAAAFQLLHETDPTENKCRTMGTLRSKLASLLSDRSTMKKTHADFPSFSVTTLDSQEKVAFRRMMSRYWDNLSPFALDLVGAVIRQGSFIQKMDQLDWLHSPTVRVTVARLIKKYELFFRIMAENPHHMAVPTLDVDLAWHTHQLCAARYYTYSTAQTARHTKFPIFVDHDDKVDENRLSDGFEWTSSVYKSLTGGELYSECVCWYCEATRASDLHRSTGIFSSSSSSSSSSSAATTRARNAVAKLHSQNNEGSLSHPDRNPHISAHNAIRPRIHASFRPRKHDPRETKMLRLRSAHSTARRRAVKRGGPSSSSSRNDDPTMQAFPMAWGIPVYAPGYAPYMCDPGLHQEAYVANPSCGNQGSA
ncbi:hypothetical protein FE257_000578 [Aspergillus nanangensis]|uniref:Uncharacterized protein n=1 Tax=Aspergillus nanangensis TaxID=2582783 RepID=A0AAD4CFB1_ASPNN|nr:hypothetical protein FE257_000578 [Aspergillus nanangensis]